MGKYDAGGSGGPPQDQPSTADQIDQTVNEHLMKRDILAQDPTLSGDPGPIAAGGAGGGGSYRLDPDEVRADMDTFHGLIQEMKELRGEFEKAHGFVHSPAEDGPSNRQSQDFADSILKAMYHGDGCIAYSDGFHDKLARSIGDYEAAEQHNYDAIRKADPGSGKAM